MNFKTLASHLNELTTWYGDLGPHVREDKASDATLLTRVMTDAHTELADFFKNGNSRGVQRTMQGLLGVLSRPDKGSILNLRQYPALNTEALRLNANFETLYKELVAFNGGHQGDLTVAEHAAVVTAGANL